MADMKDDVPIEAIVVEALGDVLHEPEADLRARPILATHEWDSLAQLEVLAQVENRTGATLDLRAYHEVRTVADLVDLVTAAVATRSAAVRH
jgi:acyl carrier protein